MNLRIPVSWTAAASLWVAVLSVPRSADAQQHTFHLDRLEVPGAPDDGLVLFRPVTRDKDIVYAQLALGFSLNPLRMSNLTTDPGVKSSSAADAITTQLSTYASAGFELLHDLTLGVTMPVAWIETGNQQVFAGGAFGVNANAPAGSTFYSTDGPAVGDARLDARYVFMRGERYAIGGQLSVWLPTGNGSSTNFGGDGSVAAMPMLTFEYRPPGFPTLVANTGVDFRPDNSVNNPAGNAGPAEGLGIGTEWRWAIGAFWPLARDKYRFGVSLFGQTGLANDHIVGNTVFTGENTPLEWNVEGRMKLPLNVGGDHWFAGAGAGTRLLDGYGAPDFRLVVLLGTYFTIEDREPSSPARRVVAIGRSRESMKDSDGDGIPDDIDACPSEPEDHKDPDPMDGCPAPRDSDGDGIPDQFDKCPNEPEDKDGIDDEDGCPEIDADSDGILDTQDACPKVPGQPDPDPKKNGCPKFIKLEGSNVRILQQVHFETASATILPDSFPMLGEIAQLLKANPGIKRMRIEGHTDSHGAADYNLDLSQRRAASVRTWLVDRGIDSGRLESEGYGLTRPIQSNETDTGRAANRRVEFKIVDEDPHITPAPSRRETPPSSQPAAPATPASNNIPSMD
jgi:outer membrane protein OmpA-like peptidoglycan-associated protein